MVEQKRGLGRGLSALLGEANEAAAEAAEATPAVSGAGPVPIEHLHRNPDQPRRHFDEAEIESLTDSIRERGVLQPILVRPLASPTGHYQIVAGERRWRAAQRAGLVEVPVVVRELSDADALEIAILENVQRADLNAVEEAQGYKALMDRFGRTQEQVASAVGKSRSHVSNTMRLLALPEDVLGLLIEGKLTAGHARAIMTATDPAAVAQRVVEEGLSVRQAEALAKAPADRLGATKAARKGKDVNTLDLERRLSEALGLTVVVDDKAGTGELRVQYRSLEQLDMVCKKLLKVGY